MFAYCLSASAMRGGFSLVKTDTCLAGKIFSDGNVSTSDFDFEQAEWKLVAKRFQLDLFDLEMSLKSVFVAE